MVERFHIVTNQGYKCWLIPLSYLHHWVIPLSYLHYRVIPLSYLHYGVIPLSCLHCWTETPARWCPRMLFDSETTHPFEEVALLHCYLLCIQINYTGIIYTSCVLACTLSENKRYNSGCTITRFPLSTLQTDLWSDLSYKDLQAMYSAHFFSIWSNNILFIITTDRFFQT